MKKNNFLLLLLSFILLFFSCKKENLSITWEALPSPTALTLNSVHFSNDSIGHAVGGNVWFENVFLKTIDGGDTWTTDVLQGIELTKVKFDQNENGYAVGYGGNFYHKNSPTNNWQFNNLFLPSETLRDVSFWEKEKGIIVTGGAFQGGKIFSVNEDFQATMIDSFEQELSTVVHSSENIVHAVGYGIVLRSEDAGETWEEKNVSGDFFRDVHFPTPEIGYAVGYSGSIIKTTDAGATWNFLRNGDKISTSNELFRAVFFVDENVGYIVGDGGLFWKTENGGEGWQKTEDLPDVDLHDVFVTSQKGYIVGKEGKIFSFEK